MNLVQLAFPALISATSATLEAGDSAIPLDLHLSRQDRVYPDLTSREDNEVTLHVLGTSNSRKSLVIATQCDSELDQEKVSSKMFEMPAILVGKLMS